MPEVVAQRRNRRSAQPRLPFDRRLVLHRWMLHLFEADSFEKLGDPLRDPTYEGFDEENVSRFYHVLKARLFERQELSADLLLSYDQNVVPPLAANHSEAQPRRKPRLSEVFPVSSDAVH